MNTNTWAVAYEYKEGECGGLPSKTIASEPRMPGNDYTSVYMYSWILLSFAANVGFAH